MQNKQSKNSRRCFSAAVYIDLIAVHLTLLGVIRPIRPYYHAGAALSYHYAAAVVVVCQTGVALDAQYPAGVVIAEEDAHMLRVGVAGEVVQHQIAGFEALFVAYPLVLVFGVLHKRRTACRLVAAVEQGGCPCLPEQPPLEGAAPGVFLAGGAGNLLAVIGGVVFHVV